MFVYQLVAIETYPDTSPIDGLLYQPWDIAMAKHALHNRLLSCEFGQKERVGIPLGFPTLCPFPIQAYSIVM